MGSVKESPRIIAVYGNSVLYERLGYAFNLAAAISGETGKKVLLVELDKPDDRLLRAVDGGRDDIVRTACGIDVLCPGFMNEDRLMNLKSRYDFIVFNVSSAIEQSVYDILMMSDATHYFIQSTREDIGKATFFIKEMPEKGLKSLEPRLKIIINRLNLFDKLSTEEISWLLKKTIDALVPEARVIDAVLDSEAFPLALRSKDTPYAKVLRRVARAESGKTLGLALGSGGAFGLSHIGVLRVLERNDVNVDVVSGSSIGSLIAVLWALGYSSEKIERIARKLKNRLQIMRLVDFTVPVSGILAGNRLKKFLYKFIGNKTFDDLLVPVKVMAYDLANRESVAMEQGSLLEAVYMSISVPGVFKPRRDRGRVMVDGGISDPVPVDVLVKENVKKIIAVNVLPGHDDIFERNMLIKKRLEEEKKNLEGKGFFIRPVMRLKSFLRKVFTPNIFDVIITSMMSMGYMLARESSKKAQIYIHAVYPDASSVDFHKVREFIKVGEKRAKEKLEEIKELAI